jgi:tetratricopeptide (TPR) repeat protein
MAKAILTAVLIVLLNVLVSCKGNEVDSSGAKLMIVRTRPIPVVEVAGAGETDIVEQVTDNRQAYRQSLELLVEHYTKMGNNMKLQWAKRELAALDGVVQYNYIVEAGLAGPDLRASAQIYAADVLYGQALELEKKAKGLLVIFDEGLLRRALDKYNQLVRYYPTSDKIDDAAFRAGRIYEHFKEYSIAVLYYQRSYQWDPETVHPAMFKAAYILDRRLHRRAEALELYRQVVKNKGLNINYREFAETRIAEITKSDEGSEDIE